MRFFDCNTCVGRPMNAPVGKPERLGASVEELLAAMDRAGVERALVWHVAQRDHDPLIGNRLLAEAVAGRDRLVGCWTVLPAQCGELGDPDEWFARAAGANVKAFRAFPRENQYLLRAEAVGDILERMVAARLPLILSVPRSVGWENVYDLLAEFPELTIVLADAGNWGMDRYFRPLLGRYPNVHVEISVYMVDGGIESLVAACGAGRILFGSGFPENHHGGPMLALAHAQIAEADREAIAAGNLERLLGEVKL